MPIYRYSCTGCGGDWDALRSMAERNNPYICPVCKIEARRRYDGEAPATLDLVHPLPRQRFADVKTTAKLEQAKMEANWKNDKEGMAKADAEMVRLSLNQK